MLHTHDPLSAQYISRTELDIWLRCSGRAVLCSAVCGGCNLIYLRANDTLWPNAVRHLYTGPRSSIAPVRSVLFPYSPRLYGYIWSDHRLYAVRNPFGVRCLTICSRKYEGTDRALPSVLVIVAWIVLGCLYRPTRLSL